MAKKKIKIPIKEKLHYKKPLKNCNKAIDDISRIRNNEQAKLRRRINKFDSIPSGKKGKGRKLEADALRKEINAYTRGIEELKGTVKRIRTACGHLDTNKGTIKSLKLKNAHIERKLKKMYESKDFSEDYKKLSRESVKNNKVISELNAKNTDILYKVNKGLGFEPEVIAERLDMRKKDLERDHREDFDEEYFETEEEIEEEFEGEFEGEGGGAAPEEIEPGYIEISDTIFWQAKQDFDKNVSYSLAQYQTVTITFNRHTTRFSGSSLMMISMKYDELYRWAVSHESYIRVIKLVSQDQTKLKFIAYWDKDGRPV